MSEVQSTIEKNEELESQLAEAVANMKGYEKDYDELCLENDKLKLEIKELKNLLATYEDEEAEEIEDEEAEEIEDEASEQEEEAEEDEEAMEEEDPEASEEDDEMGEEEEEASEEDEQQARAKELAKALRSMGIEPVATKPQTQTLSRAEAVEKFANINDPIEKGRFYAQNRDLIFNN